MTTRFSRARTWILCVCLAGTAGGAWAQAAILTMAEKPVRIIRGATVYKAVSGTLLQKDDIVETAAGGAQVEAGPNAIFAMGPETRLYVASLATDAKAVTELQVLQGWVKLASNTAKRPSVATAALQVGFGSGAVIVNSKPGKDALFADEGEQLAARLDDKGKPGAPVKVLAEQYAFVVPGQPLVVQARPARDFLGEMPPAFRDRLAPAPLPAKGGKLPAVKEREADYADVEAWLSSSLAVRKSFVSRFRLRLKDPEFRRQLDQAMGKNSEWKAVLYPPAAPAKDTSIY
jgi:hypothetical protein